MVGFSRAELKGKTVVYGITGGIAAYKAPIVVRQLQAAGFEVRAVMTPAAREFVTPLVLQTLTGAPVYTDMFRLQDGGSYEIDHIALAEKADLMLVAPATADSLAKLASGMADDPVSCTALATKAPILVCPAMNTNMLENPATRENLKTLAARGVNILDPDTGELACGVNGAGRMPDPERIEQEVCRILTPQDLAGRHILITAGPTCEDLDPVRFLTNRSTGRMGAALAEAACMRGARVTVVSGPVEVEYAPWVAHVRVRSASEMLEKVRKSLPQADVLIMAAAVADYTPREVSPSKIKKKKMDAVALESTCDILAAISADKGPRFFVGFAAETENETENAREKMRRKGLDMIVANTVGQDGTGFASATNSGAILLADGSSEPFVRVAKRDLADMILDQVRNSL